MVILIILLVLIAIGILIGTKSYDYDLLGWIITMIFGLYLVIHLIAWGIASYDYNGFVAKRNAFEATLKDARVNGNEYETAAIVKNVAAWNESLAIQKYNNTLWLIGDYTDDRIDALSPIK